MMAFPLDHLLAFMITEFSGSFLFIRMTAGRSAVEVVCKAGSHLRQVAFRELTQGLASVASTFSFMHDWHDGQYRMDFLLRST